MRFTKCGKLIAILSSDSFLHHAPPHPPQRPSSLTSMSMKSRPGIIALVPSLSPPGHVGPFPGICVHAQPFCPLLAVLGLTPPGVLFYVFRFSRFLLVLLSICSPVLLRLSGFLFVSRVFALTCGNPLYNNCLPVFASPNICAVFCLLFCAVRSANCDFPVSSFAKSLGLCPGSSECCFRRLWICSKSWEGAGTLR